MSIVEPPANSSYVPPQTGPVPQPEPTVMTMNTDAPPVPPEEKKNSGIPVILPAIGIVLILVAFIGVISYLLVVRPKAQLIKNSKELTTSLTPLKASLKEVHGSLKNMYDLITNQQQPGAPQNTLLRLNVDSFVSQLKQLNGKSGGVVAGAPTTDNTMNAPLVTFAASLKTAGEAIRKSGRFGAVDDRVLGTSTALETQRITRLRQLKSYALSGSSSAANANSTLTELQKNMSAMLDSNLNTDLYPVLKDLGTTNLKAQSFLLQANRTTSYYQKIAEVQIKLEPMLVSYLTLIKSAAQSDNPEFFIDRIKEIESTMAVIDKDIKAIPVGELPEGMDALHSDNVKVGEILLTNVREVRKSLESRNFTAFVKNIVLVSEQLEPISTRAVSTELSFWQDNTYLREADQITAQYDTNGKSLDGLIQKNKIPYLTGS